MKKNILKFVLDAVMGIVFALLFNTQVLGGLTFHEIAGLAIGGAVLFHILLNAKWVKKVTVGIFSPKTKAKQRLEYILDVLCLVDLAAIIITGVLISKVLFPSLGGGENHSLTGIHTATSYIGLLLIGVHLGLHRQWICSTVRNLFHMKGHSKVRVAIGNVCAVVLLATGVYFMTAVNFVQQVASLGGGAQSGQMQGQGMGNSDQMQAPDGSTMQAPDGSSQQAPDGSSGKGQKGNRGSAATGSTASADATAATATTAASTVDSSTATSAAATTVAADTAAAAQGGAPDGSGSAPSMPDGTNMGSGNGNGMMDGSGHGKGGDANPLTVLLTYFSIMGAFAVITGYIEMLINRVRRGKKNGSPQQGGSNGSAAHAAPAPSPYAADAGHAPANATAPSPVPYSAGSAQSHGGAHQAK